MNPFAVRIDKLGNVIDNQDTGTWSSNDHIRLSTNSARHGDAGAAGRPRKGLTAPNLWLICRWKRLAMSDEFHDGPTRRTLIAGSLAAMALAAPAPARGKRAKGPKAAVILTVTGLDGNGDGTFQVSYSGIARDLRPGASGDVLFTGNIRFDFASADQMHAAIIEAVQSGITAFSQFTELSPNQVSVLIV
jgi:hypothetical protein